jgi:hypothetical protein
VVLPSRTEIARGFQPTSASECINRRVAGKQIDERETQLRNTEPSIHESRESLLNVTVERDRQSAKQFSQSFSTDDGTQIDESDEQDPNAETSIRESRQSDSNVTAKRDEHPEND